jgi:hypothetical protein
VSPYTKIGMVEWLKPQYCKLKKKEKERYKQNQTM